MRRLNGHSFRRGAGIGHGFYGIRREPSVNGIDCIKHGEVNHREGPSRRRGADSAVNCGLGRERGLVLNERLR